MHRTSAELLFRTFRKLRHLGVSPRLLDPIQPSSLSIDTGFGELRVPWRFVPHHAQADYEPLTCSSMSRVLRRGMTFLDVGAHIGALTVFASHLVGDCGRVIAVEPFEENLCFLDQNIALNRRTNIETMRCAVADKNGRRIFKLTSSSDSNSFFEHPNIETNREIEVEIRTIDSMDIGGLDAAKIDVEGAELLVLDGMQETLAMNQQIVMWIEWMPRCLAAAGFEPMALPNRLRQLGFESIEVLDDVRSQIFTVDQIRSDLENNRLPFHWYANLLVRRRSG